MKWNMSIADKRKNTFQLGALALSLTINILILAIALIFSNMEFGTNDDRDISNLLANVYGTDLGYYIPFVNIILTKSLSVLYAITNNVANWYVVCSLAAAFTSLTALGYVLIRRSRNAWIGMMLAFIMTGLLYENHYITFQFTQNAALITMAGVVLLVDILFFGWDKQELPQVILGSLLVLFGSLLRFQSVYFAFPYLLMYVGYELVFLKKARGFSKWIGNRWKALVSIAVTLILVFAARGIHNYVYDSNPTLNAFYQEHLLRVELLDYGFPSYEENAEAIDELGLTEEDIQLFQKQCFLDKDVYSVDVLESLVAMKSNTSNSVSLKNLRLSSVPNVLKVIKSDIHKNLFWQAMLVVALLFVMNTRYKRWLVLLGSMVVPLAMIWYFDSVNRMPYRVWYSVVAPAVISLIYICAIDYRKIKIDRKKVVTVLRGAASNIAMAVIVLSVAVGVCQRAMEDDSVKITDDYERILAVAEEHSNIFVLMDRPTISVLTYNSTISPLTCLDAGSQKNVCLMGGWICWTPGNLSALSNFNTSNVFQSISEGMDVILVDARNPEMKLSFIQRHYNENVCMKEIGTIGTAGIYRFYIQDNE